MKRRVAIALVLVLAGASTVEAADNPAVAARRARDQAEVESLRKVIDETRSEARRHGTPEVYERLAQFELWLCEAAFEHNDDKLIKQAAEAGVAAAEKAVALNPNNSWSFAELLTAARCGAHQVFGIPHRQTLAFQEFAERLDIQFWRIAGDAPTAACSCHVRRETSGRRRGTPRTTSRKRA